MKQLLYVEDDEVLAEVTTRALHRRGFNVTHYSGIEAVKRDPRLNHFSHALLDLRLEDGNAMSLINELSVRHNHIKILILTGYASIATAVQAVKLGAINYLAKPATAEQIAHAFEESPQPDHEHLGVDADEQLSLKRMEWELIQQALSDNHGNISATARQLKMHRRTLQRKLSKKPSYI
ncbi:MAG: response regulator [Cellvibrionaceae bacterium]|nr:response regulator [Cellvibrionaceae bacterium]